MKSFILLLVATLPWVSQAFQRQTVILSDYLFAGTFMEMSHTLESQLIAKIKSACAGTSNIEIQNLSVNFELGELSAGTALPAQLEEREGKLVLDFPHHPKANLSASFECH